MQIKTVIESHSWPGCFDDKVNEALGDGWQLVRRDILPGSDRFYAELVKDDKPEPSEGIHWQQAMLTVRQMCDSNHSCSLCPAIYNCLNGAPHKWDMASLLGVEK